MSFIRIGRYEVNPDFIQYVHETDEGNLTAHIGLGEYATKGPSSKRTRSQTDYRPLTPQQPIKNSSIQ